MRVFWSEKGPGIVWIRSEFHRFVGLKWAVIGLIHKIGILQEDADVLLGDMSLESFEYTSGSDMGCSQELYTDTLSNQKERKKKPEEKDTLQEQGKERHVNRVGTEDGNNAMIEDGEDLLALKSIVEQGEYTQQLLIGKKLLTSD